MNISGFHYSDNKFIALIEIPTKGMKRQTKLVKQDDDDKKQVIHELKRYNYYLSNGSPEPKPKEFEAIETVLNYSDSTTRKLIEDYYLSEHQPTLQKVADSLGYSVRQITRYKDQFINDLVKEMVN